jgi:hypothetical protein
MSNSDLLISFLNKCILAIVVFLIAFRATQFFLTWVLVIIEDFCHMFVPEHKKYTLWFFKKADNIINKFRWDD